MKIVTGKGEPRDQAESAIKEIFGQDRVISEIEEELGWLGNSFPRGATYFHVESRSSTCTHTPQCTWHNHVFHYKDRCVVLSMEDMVSTSIAAIARELTKE